MKKQMTIFLLLLTLAVTTQAMHRDIEIDSEIDNLSARATVAIVINNNNVQTAPLKTYFAPILSQRLYFAYPGARQPLTPSPTNVQTVPTLVNRSQSPITRLSFFKPQA